MTSRHVRLSLAIAVLLGASVATPAHAQATPTDTRIEELERKLEQSLKRIDELSDKVRHLEADHASPAAAPAPAAVPPAVPAQSQPAPAPATPAPADQRIDDLQSQVSQLSQSVSRINTDTGVPLHGFADVGARFYTHTDPNSLNNANGANEKLIDFYLNPEISPRIKSLMEIAIETGEYDQSVGIDMERLEIGYVESDALTIWAGRFHTPFGYWNTAYHHGAWIQTSIQRPKFLAFEDTYGFMPDHSVGLLATGRLGVGGGHVTYDLTVGNSQRILTGALNGTSAGQYGTGQVDMNLLGSNNHSASTLLGLGYEFGGALDGLKIGGEAMKWRSTDDVVPVADTTDMSFVGAYAVYTENDWEVLNEYYHFHDKNVSSGGSTHSSWAAYSQVGYNLGSWTPYVRWEGADLDQSDNYFGALAAPIGSSYRRYLGGLRYDVTRSAALKFEYNSTVFRDRDQPSYNEYRLQFAVRF